MPLTPADVHNVAFSKPPIGKRGYNEDEVDAFLDMVEHELTRLLEENNELKQRVEDLDQQLKVSASASRAGQGSTRSHDAGPSKEELARREAQASAARAAAVTTPAVAPPVPPAVSQPDMSKAPTQAPAAAGAPSAESGDHNVRAAKILGLAQEMADRLTSEAKADAEQLVGDARTKSEQMLSDAKSRSESMLSEAKTKSEQMVAEARSKSESMVSEARSKSEAMLSDARTRSETMQRQAKEKADALQAESDRKHAELMGSITEKRTGLEKNIEELSTFEREYRTRLKTYLESQLHELGQRGAASPADSARRGADTLGGRPGSASGARTEQGN
ncbi:MAG: DivIVA domain-containing protein [Mycobacteriaceae bacterium]